MLFLLYKLVTLKLIKINNILICRKKNLVIDVLRIVTLKFV